eukprot:9053206-Pyramimonas_sp.AAC.1
MGGTAWRHDGAAAGGGDRHRATQALRTHESYVQELWGSFIARASRIASRTGSVAQCPRVQTR